MLPSRAVERLQGNGRAQTGQPGPRSRIPTHKDSPSSEAPAQPTGGRSFQDLAGHRLSPPPALPPPLGAPEGSASRGGARAALPEVGLRERRGSPGAGSGGARAAGRARDGGGRRVRLRGVGPAGPGGADGAGQGADRGGQCAGAAAEDDRQVFQEVHRETRKLPGQLGAEVHRHVHGPLHGRLEHGFPRLQLPSPEGARQHVRGGAEDSGQDPWREKRTVHWPG